jgi:hypothetical protein
MREKWHIRPNPLSRHSVARNRLRAHIEARPAGDNPVGFALAIIEEKPNARKMPTEARNNFSVPRISRSYFQGHRLHAFGFPSRSLRF